MADTPQKRGDVWIDPATRAARGLDVALSTPEEAAAVPAGEETALPEAPSNRQTVRTLLLTTDQTFFAEGSATQREYLALAPYFDELHVIVLCDRTIDVPPELRLAENVWVYATLSRSSFFAMFDASRIARTELTLTSGFRVDIVIARDAYESGFAAWRIARRFGRPLQLVLDGDPLAAAGTAGFWRRFAARVVVRRAHCILVHAARVREALVRRFRALAERITVLPPVHDLAFYQTAKAQFDFRAQYPQFKFVILVISSLEPHDRVDLAIDACSPILEQYPTIGLVIVGEGSEHAVLSRRVAERGLYERVLFVSETTDLVSYLRAANLYLNVAADEAHEALLFVAAATQLPILTVTSPAVAKLFKDGTDAFVCPADDPVCLTARVGEFLNDNTLRKSFGLNGRAQVLAAVHQDPATYRDRFAGILESCVLTAYRP